MTYLEFPGLLCNPWRRPHSIRKLQEKKLRKMVLLAYDHVPFYRRLFDAAGLRPEDIRTVDDLRRLPLTSKSMLLDQPLEDVTANDIDLGRCLSFSTSGTTGIPLRAYFTPRDSARKNLAWIRSYVHCGAKPWHKMAAFVGSESGKRSRSWYERFGLWRRKEISSRASPEAWVRELRRWKPQVILGYVMTLRILAEYLRENCVQDVRPRLIIHTSAVLDSPSREFLEEVFGCRVLDIYGSYEGGCLAWECPACGGYHMAEDTVVFEVLTQGRPARPGESGDVVLTNLHSSAMPFLRYKQGDIVTLSSKKPSCGRRFSLLEKIEGRADDFIRLKDGQKLSPHPFYHCLDSVPGVQRWRLTQEDPEGIRVEIEPGKDFNRASLDAVECELRRLVNQSLRVEFDIVDKIIIDPLRKFRAVNSRVRDAKS